MRKFHVNFKNKRYTSKDQRDSTDSEVFQRSSDSSQESLFQNQTQSLNPSNNPDKELSKILDAEKELLNNNIEATDEIQRFKKNLVRHIENRILNSQKKFEEQIQEELDRFEESINSTLMNIRDEHYYKEKFNKIPNSVPQLEKTFKYKPSLLSEMLKQNDYKTLYHMIMASLFILILNLLMQDYIQKGIIFDMETFLLCFQGIQYSIQSLIFIFGWGYLSIILVRLYKFNNISFQLALTLYIFLQLIQITIPCYLSYSSNYYGFGSKCIMMCEGARMGLKNHSYIRNKILYATSNKYSHVIPSSMAAKGLTEKNLKLPTITIASFQTELKRYSYFMIAPTLIYRDQYLKAPHCNKKKIIIEFVNFLMSIFFGFIIFKTFCKEPIIQLRENLTVSGFFSVIFKLMMPSTFALILLFFGLLHSWLNAWAELLRFPDRTFYLDWWTSSEFGQYYRKWNIVVHEFLYYYVYFDVQKFSGGRVGKKGGQFLTFAISALIHEIILFFALGYFYPVCFILFTGPGIFLIRQGKQIFKMQWVNIIFWILMYVGTSLMITLYLVEFYSRELVPDEFIYQQWGILGGFIPRTFYINVLQ